MKYFGHVADSPLASGEIRKQLVAKFPDIGVRRTYTYDPNTFGEHIAVHYRIANTKQNGLGLDLIPGGKVRLFQMNGDQEAFIGEDRVSPTAHRDNMVLRIGSSKDITVRRSIINSERDIIAEHKRRPTHYHDKISLRFEIENFTDTDKAIRLIETMPNNHQNWNVLTCSQWVERRIAPEKYEKVVL